MTIKTIGIIGGGQLGRMLAMAASRLNFRTVILEPQADSPAAQLANEQIVGAYDDRASLEKLAAVSDVITYEFENVPVESARFLEGLKPVYPPSRALEVAQDRLAEKTFLNQCGIPTAGFRAVDSQADLDAALTAFGGAGVLKTRRMGYDGKGQIVFRAGDSAAGAYDRLGGVPLILESFIAFEREVSIIAARAINGHIECYDAAENVHRDGILHTSTLPAELWEGTAADARSAAIKLLDALNYVGVIGIEFFAGADNSLIANEIAPRVHNSGHWTEAACVISQFEQHIRAVTGLPLGDPARHSDCIMQNLIGDEINELRQWAAEKDVFIHLYGKTEPRPGRKMGHITRLTGRV
ncbi:MAG: purK [Rhizobium sp.]|nr:purK [Rhizobium sp.]